MALTVGLCQVSLTQMFRHRVLIALQIAALVALIVVIVRRAHVLIVLAVPGIVRGVLAALVVLQGMLGHTKLLKASVREGCTMPTPCFVIHRMSSFLGR